MRKRMILGALLGSLGLILAGRSAAQQPTSIGGPAVLPVTSHEPFRNMPANATAPTKANSLKRVTDFLTTPIIKVAAFVGVRKGETKPAHQIKREQMYQKRREQRDRQRDEERMEMRGRG